MSATFSQDAAVRLNYHDGMFLTSVLMTQEQRYFVNWFTLQNRYLYTPGVLDGLKASGQNKTVTVAGGVGFDADGNFLVFPGLSNNTLSAGSAGFSPFGVYLQYSFVTTPGADTVDTAAVLAIGDASGTSSGVLLALVTLDNDGNISKVEDSRVPVASRLPADLSGARGGQWVDVDTARRGTVSFAAMTLPNPGDTNTQDVSYVDPAVPAFAKAPRVYVSVQGALPYSAEVTAVGLSGFSLTLGALQAPVGNDPIRVDWLALVAH